MWMRRHNRKHTSVIKNHPARSVMTCQCPPWEPFLRLWKALAPSSGHCHMHSPPLPLYFHFNSVGPATVIILFPQLIHIERDSNRARGGRQQCTSWHVQRAARLDWWLVQEDLGTEVTHITITAKKSVFILRLVVFFFLCQPVCCEGPSLASIGPSLFIYWPTIMRATAASRQPLVAGMDRKLEELALKIKE